MPIPYAASSAIGLFVIGRSPIAEGIDFTVKPSTLQNVIKSYLYVQYQDDDDLQAFVNSYNELAQNYITTTNSLSLPDYTNPNVSGLVLDFVGRGLYGISRPLLPSGHAQVVGPLDTYALNTWAFNARKLLGSANYYFTSDDVYRRCITWQFFKGDGPVFNIRWLKRRVLRFLIGVDGRAPHIDATPQISVSIVGRQVNIDILNGVRRITGGAVFGRCLLNNKAFNQLDTTYTSFPPLNASTLKSAIDAGVLPLPFQFTYVVNV